MARVGHGLCNMNIPPGPGATVDLSSLFFFVPYTPIYCLLLFFNGLLIYIIYLYTNKEKYGGYRCGSRLVPP
jgi:hypothetical protein